MQKLTIRNFGPIQDVEIEIKDILVFIGTQASGKSTISKAIFFFKSLRDDLVSYLYRSYSQHQFDDSITYFAKLTKQKFLKIYGSVLGFPAMELKYKYDHEIDIKVKYADEGGYLDIIFSSQLVREFCGMVRQLKELDSEIQGDSSKFSSSRELSAIKAKESELFNRINDHINRLFNDDRDILFLPAGRSLITTLSQQRYNIDLGDEITDSTSSLESDSLIKIDYLMQNFIRRIDNAKPLFNRDLANLIQQEIVNVTPKRVQILKLAQNLINIILKGSYRYQNGIEKLEFGEGQSTLINFASSGQQEIVWILLLILLLILNQRKAFLVIEEPEAHLFPVAQKQVVDLVALLANQTGNQILMTTHSPYILSSFNNLLYAHHLGNRTPEAVDQVVNRLLWIDSHRLDTYILEDGTLRSILDPETGLIESAEIDRASEIIIDIFNQLFELENES